MVFNSPPLEVYLDLKLQGRRHSQEGAVSPGSEVCCSSLGFTGCGWLRQPQPFRVTQMRKVSCEL